MEGHNKRASYLLGASGIVMLLALFVQGNERACLSLATIAAVLMSIGAYFAQIDDE